MCPSPSSRTSSTRCRSASPVAARRGRACRPAHKPADQHISCSALLVSWATWGRQTPPTTRGSCPAALGQSQSGPQSRPRGQVTSPHPCSGTRRLPALQAVRQFTATTAAALHKRIYSYSIFHIFFEQYLSVGLEACWLLGGALVSVTLVCAALTASAGAALVILVVLIMLQIDLLAVMCVWGIQLNAVSLVNLAMSLGIAVEFCGHIVHAFVVTPGSRQQRATQALRDSGASVLSGIILTKFAGEWLSACMVLNCPPSHRASLTGDCRHRCAPSRCPACLQVWWCWPLLKLRFLRCTTLESTWLLLY